MTCSVDGWLAGAGCPLRTAPPDRERALLAAMVNAPPPTLVDTEDGRQLHFLGADDRGIELHVIAVPDNRREGGLAVIHAMPTSYTDGEGDD